MNDTAELVKQVIQIVTPIIMLIFSAVATWRIVAHASAMMSAKTIEAKKEERNAIIFVCSAYVIGLMAGVIVLALQNTIASHWNTATVVFSYVYLK